VTWIRRNGLGLALLVVYLLVAAWLAVDPLSRSDWVLENLLVVLTLPLLAVFHRRLAVSRLSQVLFFLFYMLHAIGGHWSYSNVPLPWQDWGFERNHYDRIVHFSFGALLWLPIRDGLVALTRISRRLAGLFAISLTLSLSAAYEIIEWGAVAVVAPDLGQAFLGAQGDEFDAVKDMALAWLGAVLAYGAAIVASAISRPRPALAPAPKPIGTGPRIAGPPKASRTSAPATVGTRPRE
jgi:putative membrane protein